MICHNNAAEKEAATTYVTRRTLIIRVKAIAASPVINVGHSGPRVLVHVPPIPLEIVVRIEAAGSKLGLQSALRTPPKSTGAPNGSQLQPPARGCAPAPMH